MTAETSGYCRIHNNSFRAFRPSSQASAGLITAHARPLTGNISSLIVGQPPVTNSQLGTDLRKTTHARFDTVLTEHMNQFGDYLVNSSRTVRCEAFSDPYCLS